MPSAGCPQAFSRGAVSESAERFQEATLAAAAAAVVVAAAAIAAAAPAAAAAAADQQNEDDDPAAVPAEEAVITHTGTSYGVVGRGTGPTS